MKTNKILAVIVNFGESQLQYLDKVVSEFESFKDFEVDIIIHSNIELQILEQQYNNVKVNVIDDLDDYEKLPFTTRKTIYDNRDNYDFFIYNENDHLFKESHIKSFIEVQKSLPGNYIAGHIQYEEYDEGYFYPAYHAHYTWDINSVEKFGDYVVAEFTNKHQASFLLNKRQLHTVISRINFLEDDIRDGYNIKPRAGTTPYTSAGFKKVIPISHFKDFMIHHLPNKYKEHIGIYEKQMGRFDDVMKNDLKVLMSRANRKIEVFVRHCNFSENSVGKTRLPSFSRELCYHNLKRTSSSDSVNITFMMDGDNVDNHFLKNENEYKIVTKKGGTDAHSFLNLLEYVREQDLDDDTIVYILEDDFFHKEGWDEILREGFNQTNADYISLYDHKDKYFLPAYKELQSSVIHTNSSHWRTSPSTVNTYATEFKTFKKHFDIHKEFCDLDRGFTRDHDKFIHLWQNGSNLITSIPGYSTHMEVEYLSPTIDWENLLVKEKDMIGEQ